MAYQREEKTSDFYPLYFSTNRPHKEEVNEDCSSYFYDLVSVLVGASCSL